MAFLNQFCIKKKIFKKYYSTWVKFSFCLLFDKISTAQPFAIKMHLTELVKTPWQLFLLHSNQLWPSICNVDFEQNA